MLSYARGLQFPLREQNIYEALKEKITLSPNHEALVVPHQQKRFTFSQLHATALAYGPLTAQSGYSYNSPVRVRALFSSM
jgi:hypothetical protein